jgi:Tfp pilus assembly protein PilZ
LFDTHNGIYVPEASRTPLATELFIRIPVKEAPEKLISVCKVVVPVAPVGPIRE